MIQPDQVKIKSGFAVDGKPSQKAGEKAVLIFSETNSDRLRSNLKAEKKSPEERRGVLK